MYDYAGMPDAWETDWQDRVLAHLGLRPSGSTDGRRPTCWVRTPARPWARHGPVFPPTVANRVPLLERARGGSLLNGEGGDEVLGPQRITSVVGTWRRRRRVDAEVVRAVAVALRTGAGPRGGAPARGPAEAVAARRGRGRRSARRRR